MRLPQAPQTAQAAAGVAALNCDSGIVTTEALVTAAGGTYTLTLGCNQATPASIIVAQLSNGTNTQGDPEMPRVVSGDGKITFTVINRHATQALNGNLQVRFAVFN